ncbi:hypothetical protein MPSEU_001025300 [Mayamaea pseudoterrestris]|nr:hypothetical protein MPSEU_001025300 [Mayamaea pseudoterrestris]
MTDIVADNAAAATPVATSIGASEAATTFDANGRLAQAAVAEAHDSNDNQQDIDDNEEDVEAWKKVHATLIEAVIRAQAAVQAQQVQKRFWLEEIAGNLNDHGKLSAGSVWKRPMGGATGIALSSGAKASTTATSSAKRKADNSHSNSKNRKKKLSEGSEPDDDDPERGASSPMKKAKTVLTRTLPTPGTSAASSSSSSHMQPIYPHPPLTAATIAAANGPATFRSPHFVTANNAMDASQWSRQNAAAVAQAGNLQYMAAVAFGQSNNHPGNFFFPQHAPSQQPLTQQHSYPQHPAAPPRNYASLHDLEENVKDDDSDEDGNRTF